MHILFVIRLIFRLLSTAGSLKDKHNQELEEFDKKHHISTPQSKRTSNIVIWIKIILISLLMGDFEFLGEFKFNKYMSVSALIFVGVFVFLYIAFIMKPCEKENQRREAHKKEYTEFKINCAKKIHDRRSFRKNSKYLDDFGF